MPEIGISEVDDDKFLLEKWFSFQVIFKKIVLAEINFNIKN